MAITKKLCVQFCDELLEKFIIPDENILSFEVFCEQDCKDVVIKISTEDDEYKFTTNLIQNSEILDDPDNGHQYLNRLNKSGPISVAIRDVSITNYNPCEFAGTSASNLKSILGYIASRHAKYIRKHYLTNHTVDQTNVSLYIRNFKEIQDVLCKAIAGINVGDIEENLLKEGVENLVNQHALKQADNVVYTPSYPLQNRLIFQSNNNPEKCKVVNTGLLVAFPLVHDVLLTIFHLSSQKLRQHHFQELVEYYHHSLEKKLHNLGLDLPSILSIEDYERQIKDFLPIVKLDIAYNCCQKILNYKDNSSGYSNSNKKYVYDTFAEVAVLELYECLLYPNLSREDCYRIVKNKIGHSNYIFLNWSVAQLEDRPGFLGDYFKLKIGIDVNGEVKKLNLFAKYLPTTNDIVKGLADASFLKEKFFYHTFISELRSVGLDELLDFSPNCYLSRSNDVLIFEDLSLKNYKSLDKTEPLSFENMRLVIKKLVRLHACSILYEEKLSEKYEKPVRIDDKYSEYLKEVNLQLDEVNGTNKITIAGIHATINYILNEFPDIPKKMTMETFKEKVNQAYHSMFKKVKKSDSFRNVICQGDFWATNILYKMKEGDTPVDCCIIDYQLIRYCPPTHDLFFLIYVNSDKATRSEYMSKLIDEYYSELSSIIERYDFDLNKIYTYQQFLECCEYMKPAGLCIATLLLPLIMCPGKKMQDLLADEERAIFALSVDMKEIINEILYHEGPFRQRIREIVEELYNVCEAGAV